MTAVWCHYLCLLPSQKSGKVVSRDLVLGYCQGALSGKCGSKCFVSTCGETEGSFKRMNDKAI